MTDKIDDNGGDDKSDPFDLAALREPQSLAQVRRRRLVVPVQKKPNRHQFVRVNPDPAYQVSMLLFKPEWGGDKDDEYYFVHPSVAAELENECRLYTVYTGVTLAGDPFLWIIPVPNDNGQDPNTWLISNREAAELAKEKWIRVASDLGARAYCVHECDGLLAEPKFPTESFRAPETRLQKPNDR
jgi:hypothetical protein